MERPTPGPTLRGATRTEGALLSALALRSKAVWGYDEAFLELCREELRVDARRIARGGVVVADLAGEAVGFAAAAGTQPLGRLDMLFVDPAHLRRGIGRALLTWVSEAHRDRGFTALTIDADPGAEPFYRAMGAVRIGRAPSGSVPGRFLPRLRLELR